jgi:hypothetical protein
MKGKIKVENKGLSINLSGDISSDDVREINNLLRLYSQITQISALDKVTFSELSKDLKTNKDFLKIQDSLLEEHEDYHYVKYTKLNKIIEITQEDKKINTVSKVNQKDLSNKLKTLFDDIEVPNVEFVLVHTSGDLDLSEHEKIFFAIQDKLLEIPTKHVVTKKNSNNVLLELVFFGRDVVDDPYFDLD